MISSYNKAWIFHDGGRKESGYKGSARDCGARALAIAAGLDYQSAYRAIAEANKNAGFPKTARNGVHKNIYNKILKQFGFVWRAAPTFKGRKARCSDLKGTVIARQSGHFVAVVDGVPRDTFDSSSKMVYGFWETQS